jgi:hypothetical protein
MPDYVNPTQSQMLMQMMEKPAIADLITRAAISNGPNYFFFNGSSISLQTRLETMTDEEANKIIDATIVVTGREVQSHNNFAQCCTILWGSIFIFPLCFTCCDWWRRCVLPAYDIDFSVYVALAKLFRSPNLRNLSLTVIDSTFDNNKSSTLYQMVSESRVNGFTFINQAGEYNFLRSEYSDFRKNMKPFKMLPKIMSDIRWGSEIVL